MSPNLFRRYFMAYLNFVVGGNPNFGGYVSMDGDASVPIKHDDTYRIQSGVHQFTIYTRSDAQRKVGQGASIVNSLFGSGGILGFLADNRANNAMGESWSFQASIYDDELLVIEIVSRGNDILSAPQYRVRQLDDEMIQEIEKLFE